MEANMSKDLVSEITAYTAQLDNLVSKMKDSNFPFSDSALIYEEVSEKLKSIISGSENN